MHPVVGMYRTLKGMRYRLLQVEVEAYKDEKLDISPMMNAFAGEIIVVANGRQHEKRALHTSSKGGI